MRQCIGGLDAVATDVAQRHCAGVEFVAQRSAVHILHGDEGRAADVADFVDRADVRMVQGGCVPCLTQHTGSRRFVVASAVDNLQSNVPMKGRVEGEEHDTHPSAPEHALDAVGAEHLAGLREAGRLWRVQTRDSTSAPRSTFPVPRSRTRTRARTLNTNMEPGTWPAFARSASARLAVALAEAETRNRHSR